MTVTNSRTDTTPAFRVERTGPLLVAGLQIRCTSTAAKDIPALWQRFGACVGAIPAQVGSATYGVCRQDESGQVDYLAGVEVRDVSNLSNGLSFMTVPEAQYAVFRHDGHVATIRSTIDDIFRNQLTRSGYAPGQSPFLERYGAEFNVATGLGGVEIWVPVQRA